MLYICINTKKFEPTNMDLTYLYFLILLGFPVRVYGCSTIYKIVPYTTSFKLRMFLVTDSKYVIKIKIPLKPSLTYLVVQDKYI